MVHNKKRRLTVTENMFHKKYAGRLAARQRTVKEQRVNVGSALSGGSSERTDSMYL